MIGMLKQMLSAIAGRWKKMFGSRVEETPVSALAFGQAPDIASDVVSDVAYDCAFDPTDL